MTNESIRLLSENLTLPTYNYLIDTISHGLDSFNGLKEKNKAKVASFEAMKITHEIACLMVGLHEEVLRGEQNVCI